MPENRKRNVTLTIRVTEAEKAAIAAKARRAKLSLTDYIVTFSRQVERKPPPDLSPLLLELKRIGNNLNQIAAKVNSGVTYIPDLSAVMDSQNKIHNQLLSMMENESWQL